MRSFVLIRSLSLYIYFQLKIRKLKTIEIGGETMREREKEKIIAKFQNLKKNKKKRFNFYFIKSYFFSFFSFF